MDYKEKYSAALERAEILIEKLESTHIKEFIYHIFPELLESEDERIRKSIIAILDNYIDNNNTIKPAIMNWLEKQSKQKQTWKPSAAQLIVIEDLIEDENTSKVNKVILQGMLEEFDKSKKSL